MRLLLLLIFPLLFGNAFSTGIGGLAGGSGNGKISINSKWSDIRAVVRKDRKLKITGDYAYVGQIVSIFDVCTDGENFITKEKLPVYKQVRVPKTQDNDGQRDGFTSKIVDYKHRIYPLNHYQTKRVCDGHGKNCKYVDVEFNQDTQKDIKVEKFLKTEGSSERAIYKEEFTKRYFVQDCK